MNRKADISMHATEWWDTWTRARLQAETGGAVGFVAMVSENVRLWTEGGGQDIAVEAEAVY